MSTRSFFALVISITVFCFAIFYSASEGNDYAKNIYALKIKSLAVFGILLAWFFLRPPKELLGLGKGKNGWKWLGIMLALLCGAGVVLYGMLWKTHGAPHWNMSHIELSRWALMALHVALIGPLLEELLFRGILQGSMEEGYPAWAAALIVAVAFSLMHGPQVPTIILGAVAMCFLRYKTKVIWPGFLLHMMGNAAIFFIDEFVVFGNL